MKKILLLTMIFAIVSFAGYAQKLNVIKESKSVEKNVNASRADNGWYELNSTFTATDINGVTHDIQEYLNQGKYVFIDLFCAWCSPCWSWHSVGYFEQVYNSIGQGGSGDFVLLMIECETTNTTAQITGTSTSTGYDGYSQGDFTNGGSNPVPIIDASTSLKNQISYLINGGYPTFCMISPSGYYKNDIYSNPPDNTSGFYDIAATAPAATDASPTGVTINGTQTAFLGQTYNFTASSNSVSNVSYSWTFEGATPSTSTASSVDVMWNTVGTYQITLVATNENGSASATKTVNVVDCSGNITVFPYTENFDAGLGCWTVNDADGDGYNWVASTDLMSEGYGNNGSAGCLVSQSYDNDTYTALSPNNWIISPAFEIPQGATSASMSFYAAAQDASYAAEHYGVYVSTTTTNLSDFTVVFEETMNSTGGRAQGTWKQKNIDLTGYAGETIYVAFRHFNTTDMFYLLIDDVVVNVQGSNSGINENNASSIALYPNPTTGILNITAEDVNSVEVYDITGRVVMMRGAENTIDMSELEAGVYFVNVATANGSAVQRVVKE